MSGYLYTHPYVRLQPTQLSQREREGRARGSTLTCMATPSTVLAKAVLKVRWKTAIVVSVASANQRNPIVDILYLRIRTHDHTITRALPFLKV